MRLSYFSNDKKSLSQQLFVSESCFGKYFFVSESTFVFRKVVSESTFFFWKVLSKSDFGKCENAFPNHLPKQLSPKKNTFHVWQGLLEMKINYSVLLENLNTVSTSLIINFNKIYDVKLLQPILTFFWKITYLLPILACKIFNRYLPIYRNFFTYSGFFNYNVIISIIFKNFYKNKIFFQ